MGRTLRRVPRLAALARRHGGLQRRRAAGQKLQRLAPPVSACGAQGLGCQDGSGWE